MTLCYLALGSNLNNPSRQIRLALAILRKEPKINILKVATLFFNEAMGKKSQPRFCNTVIAIQTSLSPLLLLKRCQEIEGQLGRTRKIKWGPRIIDIDILLYGNLKIKTSLLTIPHPGLYKRDFVLTPLQEITNLNYTKIN